jgi:hypothetical protein
MSNDLRCKTDGICHPIMFTPPCINPAFCNNGGEIDFVSKKRGKDEEA